jgi:hypothetical protein
MGIAPPIAPPSAPASGRHGWINFQYLPMGAGEDVAVRNSECHRCSSPFLLLNLAVAAVSHWPYPLYPPHNFSIPASVLVRIRKRV